MCVKSLLNTIYKGSKESSMTVSVCIWEGEGEKA